MADDTLSVSPAGVLSFVGTTDANTITVANDPVGLTYTIGDTVDVIDATSSNANVTVSGTGTNSVVVTYMTGAITSLNIDGGGGGDTIDLQSTSAPTTLTESGVAGINPDGYNLGNLTDGLQSITAGVTLSDPVSTATVSLDDRNDSTARTVTLAVDNTGQTGSITGFAPATISFTPDQTNTMTFLGGSGGNTFGVGDTIADAATVVDAGSGNDTVNVLATAGPITVDGQAGTNTTNLGGSGMSGVTGILLGAVTVNSTGGTQAVTVQDEGDSSDSTATVTVTPTNLTAITGLNSGGIELQGNVISSLTINGGSGTDVFNFTQTTPGATTTLNTGSGPNTVNVDATTGTLLTVGSGGVDTVNLGGTGPTGTLENFAGGFFFKDTASNSTVNLNDVADTTARTITASSMLVNSNPTNVIAGFAAGSISIDAASAGVVNVDLGKGGDTVTLPISLAPLANFVSIDADKFNVQGTSANDTLNIQGEGPADRVDIGDAGLVSGILGPVNVTNTTASTVLTVDDSADTSTTPVDAVLSAPMTGPTLTGFAPAPIGYGAEGISNLIVLGGPNADNLSVNFSTGNPIPGGSGLTYDAGQNPSGSPQDGLDLRNGSFSDEEYTPSGPGAGEFSLDSSLIHFSDLEPAGGASALPITDTTTANLFTIDAPAGASAIDLGNGPLVNGIQSAAITSGDSPAAFAQIEVTNKAVVAINTTATTSGAVVTVDETVPSVGLATIGVTTGSTADTVDLDATPPGVDLSAATQDGNDTVSAILPGLATSPSSSLVDGGNGDDTLNLDADGGQATLIPPGSPMLPAGTPAGFAAAIEAGHVLEFGNFEAINLSNTVAPQPVVATVPALSTEIGSPLTNALVATFTSAGLGAAAEFSAEINWGDGTSSSGTIVDDGGTFDVTGSHTYTVKGLEQVTVTVTDDGGTNTTTTGGVPTTITSTPSNPATLATTTVAVSLLPLTSAGAIFTANSGQVATGYVANFTDPNGSGSTYTAEINWGDGTSSAATAISPLSTTPTSASFTVTGSHDYAISGTYPITVTITSSQQLTTVANGVAHVSATTLKTAGVTFSAVRGVSVSGVVAGFSDPSTISPSPTYTAEINWGDGTSSAASAITKSGTTPSGGSSYLVDGTHAYANAGPFPITVTITSSAGSTATATSEASVAPSQGKIIALPINAGAGVPYTSALGTFTDEAGAEPIGDYTVFVVYNDGSDPVQGSLATTSTPGTFVIDAPHTFAYGGTFTGYIAIIAPGINATTAALTSTVEGFSIVPAAISATQNTALTNVLVATIFGPSAANPTGISQTPPPSGYQLTIDWGDGSTPTLGTINTDGTVDGSHTYTTAGTFTVTLTLGLPGVPQSDTTATQTVVVAAEVIPLTGMLSPSSDTGPSDTDGITNDNRPTFTGTAQPGSTVNLYAVATSATTVPLALGQTTADASGNYTVTSNIIPDNSYYVGVQETDASGNVLSSYTIFGPSGNPLIIDTIGPRITGVDFNRTTGVVQVTYNDERAGVDLASVESATNYSFIPIPSGKKSLPITGLTPRSVAANATQPQTIVATIKSGIRLPAGKYLLTITSGGVEDLAGNALDGEFYGYFPSGNGSPGGNFSARLNANSVVVYNTNPLNKQQPVNLASVKAESAGHAVPKGPLHVEKQSRHGAKG